MIELNTSDTFTAIINNINNYTCEGYIFNNINGKFGNGAFTNVNIANTTYKSSRILDSNLLILCLMISIVSFTLTKLVII